MRIMQHNRIIAGGFVERVATPAPFARSQRSSFPSWKAQNVWRQRNNPMQPTRTVEDFMPLHLTKGAESFAGLRGSKTRKYHLCQVDDCPRSSCLTPCHATNAKPSPCPQLGRNRSLSLAPPTFLFAHPCVSPTSPVPLFFSSFVLLHWA